MKLYKYISNPSALKSIVSGNIKFSTLSSLNDPTELLAKIIDSDLTKSLYRLRKDGYTPDGIVDLKRQEELFKILSPETMVIHAPKSVNSANQIIRSSVYDNLNYLRSAFEKTIEIMSERCGIFCVSSRYNSLPMWAHYADNAKGFVIEFKGLDAIFSGDNTGILNKLCDVNYKIKRSGVTFENGSYKSLFFEKDKDWEYENEKRVITNLSSCKELDIGNETIYIKTIPKENISKVIFGWRLEQNEVETLSNEINTINKNLELSVANVSDGAIEI